MQFLYYICDRLQLQYNKYTHNMQLPKNILKQIREAIKVDGILKTAEGCELNYRTLVRIKKTGICKDEFGDQIAAYLRTRKDKIAKRFELQDQD